MKNALVLLATAAAFGLPTATFGAAKVDFAKDIQPIFEKNCYKCHGPEKQKGKLRLDAKDSVFKRKADDQVLVPGNADKSEMVRRINLPKDDDDFMPAKADPLSKAQIELIKEWINQGADWPDAIAKTDKPKEEKKPAPAAAAQVDFAKDIKPIFEQSCVRCHGAEKQKGKLRLDTKEAALKGGADGVVLAPGHPEKSDLCRRISLPADDDDVMPNKGDHLSKAQIALIANWIKQGAQWPDGLVLKAAKPAEKQVAAASASTPGQIDFAKQIQPIFLKSCIECHGPEKQKGKLRLDTKEAALKGGSDGVVLTPGHADKSDLFRRITLPAGSDDVMPQKSDPLSKAQIELIRQWIDQGANWPDGLTILAKKASTKSGLPKAANHTPSPAELQAIAELEKMGIPVRPIAQNVNWREANLRLMGTNVTGKAIEQLKNVAGLIDLNLGGTPLTDAELANLRGLTNLTHLHLEKTPISDAGLANLKGFKELSYLNLYGTSVTDAGLKNLSGLTNLEHLYLWQTKVTDAGVAELKKALPEVDVNRGWDLAAAVKKDEPKKEEKKEEKK